MAKYDVFGIVNPLMDVSIQVDDSHLAEFGLKKGRLHLVDGEKSEKVLLRLKDKEHKLTPAGATTNTLMGMANLGSRCVLCGKLGKDKHGDVFEEIMQGTPGFYEITNYNVANRLEQIANEAGNRPLTEKEKQFIEIVQYHAERLGRDDFYKNKFTRENITAALRIVNLIKMNYFIGRRTSRPLHSLMRVIQTAR